MDGYRGTLKNVYSQRKMFIHKEKSVNVWERDSFSLPLQDEQEAATACAIRPGDKTIAI